MRVRLSLLMFLMFASPGALLPVYSVHLRDDLHFPALFVAVCCATQGLAFAFATLMAGQVADRWFPAQWCVFVCGVLAAGLQLALPLVESPAAVLAVTLGYWLMIVPVLMLGGAICLTHLPDAQRTFGPVRMWGTVGWVVPGWGLLAVRRLFPHWELDGSADLFRLGGALALVTAAYALTLPHTPPRHTGKTLFAPLAALRLVSSRAFFVYVVCAFGVSLTFPFTTQAVPQLLRDLQVPELWLTPVQSVAQASEIICLALLPWMLGRFGLRTTMLLGLGAWCAVFAVMAVGWPLWLVVVSLLCCGLMIAGFVIAGQLFVNGQTTGDLRASAQSLLAFSSGIASVCGHVAVGFLSWAFDGHLPSGFFVAAWATGGIFVLFLVGFRPKPAAAPAEVPAAVPLPDAADPVVVGVGDIKHAVRAHDTSVRSV